MSDKKDSWYVYAIVTAVAVVMTYFSLTEYENFIHPQSTGSGKGSKTMLFILNIIHAAGGKWLVNAVMILIIVFCATITVREFRRRNVTNQKPEVPKDVPEAQPEVIAYPTTTTAYGDGRFLIYPGFEYDAPFIFKDLINAFGFSITSLSEYGTTMHNGTLEIDIAFETVLLIWVKDRTSPKSVPLPNLYKAKSDDLHDAYWQILNKENGREQMEELSAFMFENKEVLTSGFRDYQQETPGK